MHPIYSEPLGVRPAPPLGPAPADALSPPGVGFRSLTEQYLDVVVSTSGCLVIVSLVSHQSGARVCQTR